MRLVGLLALACGGDDNGGKRSAGHCGTEAEPEPIPLRERQSTPEARCPTSGIAHRFTVVGLQAIFRVQMLLPALTRQATPCHQAEVTPSIVGNDVTYTCSPMTWSIAPGHVVIHDNALYELE